MISTWPSAAGQTSVAIAASDGDGGARAVGRELPRHPPDRLRDDRDGDDLQPVQPAGVGHIEAIHAVGEGDQRQRGW